MNYSSASRALPRAHEGNPGELHLVAVVKEGRDLMTRFRRAWRAGAGTLTLLGTIAGLTFATTGPDGKPWTQWGVGALSLSVLVFLVVFAWPELQEGIRRLRQYPKLEKSYGIAVDERDSARQQLDLLPEQLLAEREAGRKEAVGAYLAHASGADLKPVGVTVSTGELTIVAEMTAGSAPEPGARFLAKTRKFAVRRGILSVVGVDDEKRIHLRVEQAFEDSEQFWASIRQSADGDEEAPEHLEMVPDTTIFDFLQAGRNT